MRALLSRYSVQPERDSFPTKTKNHFFGVFLLYLSTSFRNNPFKPLIIISFSSFFQISISRYLSPSLFLFLSLSIFFYHTHTYTSILSPSFILIFSLSFPISLYLFFFLLFLSLMFFLLSLFCSPTRKYCNFFFAKLVNTFLAIFFYCHCFYLLPARDDVCHRKNWHFSPQPLELFS
ncbi:unnamed protein product [Acanthosepion pharaonis]|uniref:Uncharacterized protein n=1 Tax=Acanthosepion pharaonis TaxID=158019 RepID=A0A812E7Z8_ACAPH|nr:unnamed protein product [Sepia pharaonis]